MARCREYGASAVPTETSKRCVQRRVPGSQARLTWERLWWFADWGVHIRWSLLMSSLFLLWWVFFSAFPGESGITGTRSRKWKTTAGGDSYGTGGSHAEWPSPHCSGELHHSPADCPTQGKCSAASCHLCQNRRSCPGEKDGVTRYSPAMEQRVCVPRVKATAAVSKCES